MRFAYQPRVHDLSLWRALLVYSLFSYHLLLSSVLIICSSAHAPPSLPQLASRRGAVPPHFSTASTSSRHRAAPSPSPPVSRRRLRLRPPWAFAFSAGDRHRQHAAGAGARTRARDRADTRPQVRLSRFEAEWLSGSLREIELHRRRPGAGDFVIIEQGGARFPLILSADSRCSCLRHRRMPKPPLIWMALFSQELSSGGATDSGSIVEHLGGLGFLGFAVFEALAARSILLRRLCDRQSVSLNTRL